MEAAKLKGEIGVVQEWEFLGKATGPRERLWVSKGIHPSAYAPCALASRRTQTLYTAQSRIRGLFHSIFQTLAELGAGCWDLRPCQPRKAGGAEPPRRPHLRLQAAPSPQQARSKRSPNCRTPEPTPPPGGGDPAATAHLPRPLHVPPRSPARSRAGRRHRDLPRAPAAQPSLTHRRVVGEGAFGLVDPVPGPGHADRGHVGHQQLADVPCSHLPTAAAARHAEQGAPALHGRGAHRAERSRAELGLPAAAAGCAGDRSRAGAGGESGPRGGSGHRDPGASRRGRGDAAIFNPMANRGPSCSVRRGEGSASRSVPGRGRWRGALGRAGSAARGGGLARGRRLPSPGRGREAAGPCRRPAGGHPTGVRLRGSNSEAATQRAGIGV